MLALVTRRCSRSVSFKQEGVLSEVVIDARQTCWRRRQGFAISNSDETSPWYPVGHVIPGDFGIVGVVDLQNTKQLHTAIQKILTAWRENQST